MSFLILVYYQHTIISTNYKTIVTVLFFFFYFDIDFLCPWCLYCIYGLTEKKKEKNVLEFKINQILIVLLVNLCGNVITLYSIVFNDVFTDRNVKTVTCLYSNVNFKLFSISMCCHEITFRNVSLIIKL